MFERELKIHAFLLGYARLLIADIPDDQFTAQPSAGINHPAWQLGHLVFANDGAARLLGAPSVMAESWPALFGMGSKPVSDRSAYPGKDELLAALVAAHERVNAAAAQADPSLLDEPHAIPSEFLQRALPTKADLLAHLLTSHEAAHLGHLSSWRRQMGMPHLF